MNYCFYFAKIIMIYNIVKLALWYSYQ